VSAVIRLHPRLRVVRADELAKSLGKVIRYVPRQKRGATEPQPPTAA